MEYRIEIERRRGPEDPAVTEVFSWEPASDGETVATVLEGLNRRAPLLDAAGKPCEPIGWDCSCLQKKCGACAMLINGRPALACDTRLSELKGTTVALGPLRKFPVVRDLIVDRSVMMEQLREMGSWLREEARQDGRKHELLYDASRCLQCGCCLEICPNFYAGGGFYGMASMVPAARLLEEMGREGGKPLRKAYTRHIFEGCGKSLACRDICPAGLPIDSLLSNSNAAALWRHLFG